MSKSNGATTNDRPTCYPLFRTARPCLGACIVILAVVFLTTSCGTAAQAGGQGNAGQALTISGTFPDGTPNQPYNSVLTVSGGTAPYQFGIKAGSLPAGVSLNPVTGSISGTPVAEGSYSFEVGVTDAPHPGYGSQSFNITVAPGGGGGIKVTVSPSEVSLVSNQTQQFTARVAGTHNTAVIWSASAGSIDHNGLYTAPQVDQLTNVTVTATSVADKMKDGDAAVTVNKANGGPLTITTNSLPDGQMGNMYNQVFAATGGKQPYSWSATGNVPPGVTLNPNSGDFAGMPGAAGMFNFTVKVTDAAQQTAQKNFSLNITAGGAFDGPAELPRVTVASSLADTPAPGSKIAVNAGGDLQTALNNANCGDTIELQAGATYSGVFQFPAKNCDDKHWVIVRTSAPDSALPADGQRLTPCYAGVASLPNRPKYNCAHPQDVLAQVSGMGPIVFLNGANHYRLIGLEITRPQGKAAVVALVAAADTMSADHLIFDRSWIHGTAQDETRRGIALSGTTNVAIVDSYLNDFHCTAWSGTCTDSQAISGGSGNNVSGPWKIEDNFLEAAAENILFGGAPATIVPSDITIRRNHLYKVPQWQKGTPGFVGGYDGNPFVVKNNLEIKNASRVLLEANIFEYAWGGFTQKGHSIVLGPRNDYSKKKQQGNLCAVCEGTDITVRYNRISHVGAGIVVAAIPVDHLGAQAAGRISIHDTVIDDLSAARYFGSGNLFMVMNGWPARVLNSVNIRHVTGFTDPSSRFLTLGNSLSNPQMNAFTFQDNLVLLPQFPVWPFGMTNDCAQTNIPVMELNACFTTYVFHANVLINSPQGFPPAKWPTGNMFPATIGDVGFVNYNGGNGGDYHLLPNSSYKGKGSDGHDPGADIDAVNTAIQGVE
jgi:hypothetical protein